MVRRGRWVYLCLAITGLILVAKSLWRDSPLTDQPLPLAPFSLEERPQADRYLFDYAGVLAHYEEGTHEYLQRIAERFHLEGVVVTLPELPDAGITQMATDIVNRWAIGQRHEGRGLLLLLVDRTSEVKLEVGYELEDVFTDAFVGYIEDLQLRPYFQRGDLGTGLIAVMEEIERRARIKHQAHYTPGLVSALDQELLAGGGGARRDLTKDRDNAPVQSNLPASMELPGASTPGEAWRVMLAKWAGEGGDIDTDIYTELTKMAMGDADRPDPRTRAALDHWRGADYRILQDGDHAVIHFGNRTGWNNAPFLFCRTAAGWKFDIVHQRRLVVMTENPHWRIEQGNYPYVSLLSDVPQGTAKDLPLEGEDLYACAKDTEIAARIDVLERAYRDRPNDYSVIMELARLNVITGRRPNHVHPLLDKAKQLRPTSPAPHKYAAIYSVNTFFQYRTALKEMRAYVDIRPQDPFAYNFLGFLYYRLGEYEKSIATLEQAAALRSDDTYAYSLMARAWALLYQQAKSFDPRKNGYRDNALAMLRSAESAPLADAHRVARLRRWLKTRDLL